MKDLFAQIKLHQKIITLEKQHARRRRIRRTVYVLASVVVTVVVTVVVYHYL